MHVDFGVGRKGGGKAFKIAIAELMDDLHHASFNFLDLGQANLMNFFRREAGGGALLHRECIAFGSVRQRPQAGIGPPFRGVLLTHESCKCDVSREYRFTDCGQSLFAQPLLVGGGNGVGELRERLCEWGRIRRTDGDTVGLLDHFLQQDPWRH
jgi:hypothetical protein